MNTVSFCKFHGFGNDYIVFEIEALRETENLGDFAKKVCHRHTGIGGDGIAVLERLDAAEADYACRIINPDGSEAGFSGNGTRCAVAYLYYKNLRQQNSLKLKTKSGIKTYELLEKKDFTFWFRAELGRPHSFANYELQITNRVLPIFSLDVGNPVAVIFVDDFEQIDWRAAGREIETHRQFPERTNVVFVKIIDRKNIEIRIWERGAGETSSSGTCSIAAAVASGFTGKTGRQVSVSAEGGTTEAVWREDDEMLITGRADLAFCGEVI
ncbi:MAG TPA: diaminopimelate epimerase [Pyrinomonadaceae bacterium]|jgi:diaminopimelate epimerase